MTLNEIENKIIGIYKNFFDSTGINPSDGKVIGTDTMFSGAPFIGSLYPNAKRKILFVGLDIGSDEGFHSFDSRRKSISYFANGEQQIPGKKPFNAHISGTYALAFALLYDAIGKEGVWNSFSSNENLTAYAAIKKHHSEIPVELLDYICLTNAHKFVTVDRKHKGGAQDRIWNKVVAQEKELAILQGEIDILEPDIIVFQSVTLCSIMHHLQIKSNVKTIVTFHPSSRDRYHRSIEYIKKNALTAL